MKCKIWNDDVSDKYVINKWWLMNEWRYNFSCTSQEYYQTLLHNASYELERRLFQLSFIDTSYQSRITDSTIW